MDDSKFESLVADLKRRIAAQPMATTDMLDVLASVAVLVLDSFRSDDPSLSGEIVGRGVLLSTVLHVLFPPDTTAVAPADQEAFIRQIFEQALRGRTQIKMRGTDN